MPRNRRIDQTADEADRFPQPAPEIRGEKAPDLQEQAAENACEVVAAEEADLPVKAETLTALKEAREGDIIEYQGRGWSVIPLGMEVVMTAIGDDGKTLGGPDNFVAFKSYEEFKATKLSGPPRVFPSSPIAVITTSIPSGMTDHPRP